MTPRNKYVLGTVTGDIDAEIALMEDMGFDPTEDEDLEVFDDRYDSNSTGDYDQSDSGELND